MKYRIELTSGQLELVLRAINLMMRSGMGQSGDLSEWLASMGNKVKFDTSTEDGKLEFGRFISVRDTIRPVIDWIMDVCSFNSHRINTKSMDVRELETIYLAIRHRQWLDMENRPQWSTCSGESMQVGAEPVPKIERIGCTFAVPVNISPDSATCKCEFSFEKSDADEFMEWFKTEGKESFQRWRCGVRDLTTHDVKGENHGSIQAEND